MDAVHVFTAQITFRVYKSCCPYHVPQMHSSRNSGRCDSKTLDLSVQMCTRVVRSTRLPWSSYFVRKSPERTNDLTNSTRNYTLRYGEAAAASADSTELGFLKLRYKSPGEYESELLTTPITETAARPASAGWAAAMAGFGQLLKGSKYTGSWSYADAITLAEASKGSDPHGLRMEAIRLMKLAQSLNE